MNLKQIYDLAIKLGIKSDLRGEKSVKNYLSRTKKKFDNLSKEKQKEFDEESLSNPYSDSRILVDNNKKEIKKVMVGIDIEGAELLLADKLGDVDLVISHHPQGKALADLHSVMDLQAQVLADYGVPINVAEQSLKPRISEVGRNISPVNHNRNISIAQMLNIDMMCVHTPADNLGANYLVDIFNKKKYEYVDDVLKTLKKIPEYIEAKKTKTGPKLFAGEPENRCGKIAVTEFTGGTNGPKDIYSSMAQAGIGTIVGMHMGEEHKKEAENAYINVVIAGHISSDSIGMNLFIDELTKKGVEVVPVGGLIRKNRKNN